MRRRFSITSRILAPLLALGLCVIPAQAQIGSNLEACWSLDEASGNRADSKGNTLTDNNTVGSGTGRFGNAAHFVSASGEYLSAADNASLSLEGTSFTFAGWAKFDALTDVILLGKRDDDEIEFSLTLTGGGGGDMIRARIRNMSTMVQTDVTSTSFGAMVIDTWYFIVAWYDDSADTINIQINDGTVDSASHADGISATSATFALGALGDGSFPEDGWWDEVALWKSVLSSGVRTSLYNSGNGVSCAAIVGPRKCGEAGVAPVGSRALLGVGC
jgi:hypothetical protein